MSPEAKIAAMQRASADLIFEQGRITASLRNAYEAAGGGELGFRAAMATASAALRAFGAELQRDAAFEGVIVTFPGAPSEATK